MNNLTIINNPECTWKFSLYKLLDEYEWYNIRQTMLKAFNYRCTVCGTNNTILHCHENWSYDDEKHIVHLASLCILCELCHATIHYIKGNKPSYNVSITPDVIAQHYLKINNCDMDTYTINKRKALELFRLRSRYNWYVDFGNYSNLINADNTKYIYDEMRNLRRWRFKYAIIINPNIPLD